jgi:hypothetical protein
MKQYTFILWLKYVHTLLLLLNAETLSLHDDNITINTKIIQKLDELQK